MALSLEPRLFALYASPLGLWLAVFTLIDIDFSIKRSLIYSVVTTSTMSVYLSPIRYVYDHFLVYGRNKKTKGETHGIKPIHIIPKTTAADIPKYINPPPFSTSIRSCQGMACCQNTPSSRIIEHLSPTYTLGHFRLRVSIHHIYGADTRRAQG